jgi:hypothetical protein
MIAFTLVRWSARRWQYATGVAGLALVLAAIAWWPRPPRYFPQLEAALARHDSVGQMEVAHVQSERAAADGAKAKQVQVMKRVAVLRTGAATGAPTGAATEPSPGLATLPDVVALQDTAIHWANIRAEHLEVALDLSELRAARMDTLVGMLRAARDDHCRMFRVVPCPTRSALVVALVLAAAIQHLR